MTPTPFPDENCRPDFRGMDRPAFPEKAGSPWTPFLILRSLSALVTLGHFVFLVPWLQQTPSLGLKDFLITCMILSCLGISIFLMRAPLNRRPL